jgi:hypothetical protein
MQSALQPGDFVRVRSRRWLVEDGQSIEGLSAARLACIDDDARGESVAVLWDAELDAEVLADEGWAAVSKRGTDDPSVFSAYLRTLRWNTATAADRDLFQAPFRAWNGGSTASCASAYALHDVKPLGAAESSVEFTNSVASTANNHRKFDIDAFLNGCCFGRRGHSI